MSYQREQEIRTLTMLKGNHRYIFKYAIGREAELIDEFIKLANDSNSNFDWFDAAVLAYQIGQRLNPQHPISPSGLERRFPE
jgi:hypothetical protein